MATSRFNRPSYASRATPPTAESQSPSVTNNNLVKQYPQFSPVSTVSERQGFNPFGKAIDSVQNKNITTYGEDVFIEYNPAVFFGKQGLARADAYLKYVIQSYAKNEPVTEIIQLKPEFTETVVERDLSYLKNISEPGKQDKGHDKGHEKGHDKRQDNWDWWGDNNINHKIKNYELTNNTGNGISPDYKFTIAELIPEVLDKLQIANMLIRDMAHLNAKTHTTVNFRTLPASTSTSISTSGGRFAPIRRNTDTRNDRSNHVDFDDNCSIRISNFSNPVELTTYAIKDVLYEFMGDIQFKVSIPRNKETNQNKDFAFINFINEEDLNKAFALLSAQRIFMDSAILYIEVSKRRNGY